MKLNNKYILILLLFFIFSCGFYSLTNSIPNHLKNVVIQPTINETSEYKIGKVFENKFLKLLIEKNLLSITDFEKADCQLTFKIKNLYDQPYLLDDSKDITTVKHWRIEIVLYMEWFDIINQVKLINEEITESVVYSLNSSSFINENNDMDDKDIEFATNRDAAIEKCINNLSNRIIKVLTSIW